MNNIIKKISVNAIIACLYICLTVFFGPLSFGTGGIFEIRLSELLMFFAFISPSYFYGLIIGCLISNLFSGIVLDIFVGTIQTIISCFILYFLKNKKQLAIIISSLLCGIIIGLELYLLGFSIIGPFIILSLFVSELIALELSLVLFNYFPIKKLEL